MNASFNKLYPYYFNKPYDEPKYWSLFIPEEIRWQILKIEDLANFPDIHKRIENIVLKTFKIPDLSYYSDKLISEDCLRIFVDQAQLIRVMEEIKLIYIVQQKDLIKSVLDDDKDKQVYFSLQFDPNYVEDFILFTQNVRSKKSGKALFHIEEDFNEYFSISHLGKTNDYQFKKSDKWTHLVYVLIKKLEAGLSPFIKHKDLENYYKDEKKNNASVFKKDTTPKKNTRSRTQTVVEAANKNFQRIFPAYRGINVFHMQDGGVYFQPNEKPKRNCE